MYVHVLVLGHENKQSKISNLKKSVPTKIFGKKSGGLKCRYLKFVKEFYVFEKKKKKAPQAPAAPAAPQAPQAKNVRFLSFFRRPSAAIGRSVAWGNIL